VRLSTTWPGNVRTHRLEISGHAQLLRQLFQAWLHGANPGAKDGGVWTFFPRFSSDNKDNKDK
jgi:hypothetical protein